MVKLSLKEVIKSSPIVVHKGRYAYLKGAQTKISDHFMISKDKDETTIVTEERNLKKTTFTEGVKWFKLFEVKVVVPFQAPGFLALISKTIADEGLNILIVSTFSKDYLLLREEDYLTAKKALKKLGFKIKIEKN